MADLRAHRTVSVGRTPAGLVVTNVRGGTLSFGGDTDFTPTELLLAAIASCTAIDVDTLTSRRAQPVAFEVVAEATRCATTTATTSRTSP